jgi:hypothetical protein
VISFHGQDDLGLATANALAAVAAGARQAEVTVNGIGERAGNTSLEEVVVALRVHGEALGVHTGVDPSGICPLSRLVEQRSGLRVPANKAIVGRNAFRHASGIHQDGVLKARETFEVIDPALVGHERGTEIVLGKLPGWLRGPRGGSATGWRGCWPAFSASGAGGRRNRRRGCSAESLARAGYSPAVPIDDGPCASPWSWRSLSPSPAPRSAGDARRPEVAVTPRGATSSRATPCCSRSGRPHPVSGGRPLNALFVERRWVDCRYVHRPLL